MRDPKFDWQTPVVVRMDELVEEQNAVIADLVECLARIEEEDVHLDMGHSSLYAFCRERYGMSEGAAYRRIRAARVSHRHPSIIESLRCGELSLEAIAVLAPYIDEDPDMLRRAATMSVRDVRAMVAARHPDPNAPRGAWSVRPVGDGLVELKVVLTKEQFATLEQARDLDRHRNPSGDMGHVVAAGVEALVTELKKKRFAISAAARSASAVVDIDATARKFPAAARRAIAARDQLQCSYVAADGARCTATGWLELDHCEPHALGGASAAANGRIFCRPHNQREARRAGLSC